MRAARQRTTRPTFRKGRAPKLPATLAHFRAQARFVAWRYGSKQNSKGKYPKIPYNPHTGKRAKTNDPATWATWDACLARCEAWTGWFDGIGIVLHDGETGIDLDDCLIAGQMTPQAQTIVDDLAGRAYIEESVSGTGLHLITLGRVPDSVKRDDIEIYPGGRGRFFTLSGVELAGSATPADGQAALDRVFATYAPAHKQRASTTDRASCHTHLTPELEREIAEAASRMDDLLLRLRNGGMTKQLADLLEWGRFPEALNDTTPSEARAVIVYQLDRSPKPFTDAEIIALAEHLIHRHGYEGQHRNLRADIVGLLYDKSRPKLAPRTATTRQPTAPRAASTRQPAPAPIEYLRRLATERTGDTILLTQQERADVSGIPLGTAKRLDAELVQRGWVVRDPYPLGGPGVKGRKGALRLTAAGEAALDPACDPVIFSQQTMHDPVILGEDAVHDPVIFGLTTMHDPVILGEDAVHDPVKDSASPCVKSSRQVALNTSVSVCAPLDAEPEPSPGSTHTPCSSPAGSVPTRCSSVPGGAWYDPDPATWEPFNPRSFDPWQDMAERNRRAWADWKPPRRQPEAEQPELLAAVSCGPAMRPLVDVPAKRPPTRRSRRTLRGVDPNDPQVLRFRLEQKEAQLRRMQNTNAKEAGWLRRDIARLEQRLAAAPLPVFAAQPSGANETPSDTAPGDVHIPQLREVAPAPVVAGPSLGRFDSRGLADRLRKLKAERLAGPGQDDGVTQAS